MQQYLLSIGVGCSVILSGIALFNSAGSTPTEKTVQQTQSSADFSHLEEKIDQLTQRLEQLEARNVEKPTKNLQEILSEDSNSAIEQAVDEKIASLENGVVERLESKLKERMDKVNKRHRNKHGEWSPKMEELKDELQLSDQQQTSAKDIFDTGKDEMLSLFQTPQEGGGSLLDDFVADLQEGVSPALAYKTFEERIWEENIPGSERTYLTELIAIRNNMFSELKGEFNEGQYANLESLKVDPLGVQTGYDPVKDYVEGQFE